MARWLIIATAVLAAVGCALVSDGGNAPAILPDFRELSSKQWIAWGFRGPGIVLSLILGLAIWRVNRSWFGGKYPEPSVPVTNPPSPLSAAAVSILENRSVTGRTRLATVIEMCQRGTLMVVGVRERERHTSVGRYSYRFSPAAPPEHDWERLISDRISNRDVFIQDLNKTLEAQDSQIGERLGEYLHWRGLFNDNPVRVWDDAPGLPLGRIVLALALMGTGVGLWLGLWVSQWWVNAISGGVIGTIYGLTVVPMRVGMMAPTDGGRHEIGQWVAFKEWLQKSRPDLTTDPPDTLLPYAIALDVAQPWLGDRVSAPEWFAADTGPNARRGNRDEAYQALLSAPEWGLEGRSEQAGELAMRRADGSEPRVLDPRRTPAAAESQVTVQPATERSEAGVARDSRLTAVPVPERQEASTAADEAPVYAPIHEQVFLDADRVFVSDYRLQFPYRAVSEDRVRFPIRTVEMFRIRSAVVDEANMAAEAGLNKFLKVLGGLIKWPALLGAMGVFIISLWNILFLVLGEAPSDPQGRTPAIWEIQKALYEAFPVEYWIVIVLIIVGLGVMAWLGDKIMDWRPVKSTIYRVAVDVVDRKGESERLYFVECEGRDEAQRIVSAIEHAKVAIAARSI